MLLLRQQLSSIFNFLRYSFLDFIINCVFIFSKKFFKFIVNGLFNQFLDFFFLFLWKCFNLLNGRFYLYLSRSWRLRICCCTKDLLNGSILNSGINFRLYHIISTNHCCCHLTCLFNYMIVLFLLLKLFKLLLVYFF